MRRSRGYAALVSGKAAVFRSTSESVDSTGELDKRPSAVVLKTRLAMIGDL
jgi:hypothetical protein